MMQAATADGSAVTANINARGVDIAANGIPEISGTDLVWTWNGSINTAAITVSIQTAHRTGATKQSRVSFVEACYTSWGWKQTRLGEIIVVSNGVHQEVVVVACAGAAWRADCGRGVCCAYRAEVRWTKWFSNRRAAEIHRANRRRACQGIPLYRQHRPILAKKST